MARFEPGAGAKELRIFEQNMQNRFKFIENHSDVIVYVWLSRRYEFLKLTGRVMFRP
jgi:hypothetical protein